MGAFTKRRAVLAAVLGLAVGVAGPAEADLILNATATGWYDETGLHNARESNYLVGTAGGSGTTQFRDFFVFDLGGVTGTITGATLLIANLSTSGITAQTYTNYDVSTPIATLMADHLPGSPEGSRIFDDLGTGTVYGSTTALTGPTVPVSLDAAALTALNAAEGGQFAIGGALAPLTGANQYIFGITGGDVRFDLTIGAAAPEPSSLVPAGIGALAGLGYWLGRRRRAAA